MASAKTTICCNNEDLTTEILLRLPVKSLLRLRCVSKFWLSIITSSRFCHIHSLNAADSLLLSVDDWYTASSNTINYVVNLDCRHPEDPLTTLPLDYEPFTKYTIRQSCHGLLLCYENFHEFYFVCNPITKNYTILPSRVGPVWGVSLAFDPSKSPDYKVIALCLVSIHVDNNYKKCKDYHIEVYSSKTGTWRVCSSTFRYPGNVWFTCGQGVFWNGGVHWISRIDYPLYFNLDKEQLKTHRDKFMPKLKRYGNYRGMRLQYFGKSRGSLYLVISYFDLPGSGSDHSLVVYEMRRDYSEWFVKYSFEAEVLCESYGKRNFKVAPVEDVHIISVIRAESDMDSFAVTNVYKEIIRYNFKDKSCKLLGDFSQIKKEFGYIDCPFISSLAHA